MSGVLLAKTFDPEKHDPTGYWMSEKLDGVRAIWNGARFESRTGKPFHAPQNWMRALPRGIILDGELFLDRGRFQETVSIVRRKQPDARWINVRYIVFDRPMWGGPFEERNEKVMDLARSYPFEAMQHLQCRDRDHLMDFYRAITAVGGEGVMLREPGSLYIPKRSDTLLKMKGMIDGLATVCAIQPGTGKHKGRMGALVVNEFVGTKCIEFKVGTGFSDAEREQAWPIGTVIRWAAQERTLADIPRFPRYLCIDKGD